MSRTETRPCASNHASFRPQCVAIVREKRSESAKYAIHSRRCSESFRSRWSIDTPRLRPVSRLTRRLKLRSDFSDQTDGLIDTGQISPDKMCKLHPRNPVLYAQL